jgi:cation transport protein ChaC
MWDGWENRFDCLARERAELDGFIRSFNKGSERNWGTRDVPCPTLGLVASAGQSCIGVAFEFPEAQAHEVRSAVKGREGKSFTLIPHDVRLDSNRTVSALVAINDTSRTTYMGDQSLATRGQLARRACGTSGRCADYIDQLRSKLIELAIEDSAVEDFWKLVHERA